MNAFRNSVIKDCFFRVQDDVFYLGKNVRISNITTWNDSNGAVMYLTNSSSSSRFEDIKVIYHRAMWHYWGGGRVISMRDCEKSIENVHFKNIVVEDPYPAFGLFFLEVKSGAKDLNFNNIVFENIRQEAKEVGEYKKDQQLNPVNTLFGGNSSSILRNITFKNVFYAGKHLRSLEDGDFITNSYVDRDSIRFTANPSSQ